MKIYTRKGDKGLTSIKGKRLSKSSVDIGLIGMIDRMQVSLGFLIASTDFKRDFHKLIQKELFTISSVVAGYTVMVNELFESVLEVNIDEMTQGLPKLTNFVFCGDNIAECYANQCRVDCRELERMMVGYMESNTSKQIKCDGMLRIINRLSDYFFTVGRCLNQNESKIVIKTGEIF